MSSFQLYYLVLTYMHLHTHSECHANDTFFQLSQSSCMYFMQRYLCFYIIRLYRFIISTIKTSERFFKFTDTQTGKYRHSAAVVFYWQPICTCLLQFYISFMLAVLLRFYDYCGVLFQRCFFFYKFTIFYYSACFVSHTSFQF